MVLSGCFKDMDVVPKDPDTFLAGEFYADPSAYRAGLAGVYGNLSLTGIEGAASSNIVGIDAGTSQYGRGLWNLQDISTDEVKWIWENDPGIAEIQRNTWTANNVIIRGMYARTMFEVALANEYLRQTSESVLDSRGVTGAARDEITTYRAEVRFLRALAYYHMMDLFGKAAFVTEDDAVGAYQAPEYSRSQLFAFIESELKAIEPELIDPMQNEYARVDKAGAWMLLAKIYLNAKVYIDEDKYSDCLSYCEKIINSGYELTPNYLDAFKADNHLSPARNEIIFPVLSDGIITQNYGPTTVMINGQVGVLEQNGESFGTSNGGWGGALRVTRQFSEIFLNGNYDTDDRNTLITEDRPIDITEITNPRVGYVIGKWSNRTKDGVQGSALEIVDTDFPMFRLADVYLMYAEAYLRGGGGSIDNAVNYINELRLRANNPNLISSGDLSLDFILDERLVELHWEAHRRQDLIRYGRYGGGAYNWQWKGSGSNGIAISLDRNLFPVPNESLAANQNLTQNPGY